MTGPSARRTSPAIAGDAPRTSTSRSAKSGVLRATTYAPAPAAASATAATSAPSDGTSARAVGSGSRGARASGSTAVSDRRERAATRRRSPRRAGLLHPSELDGPEQLDFVLELDAE